MRVAVVVIGLVAIAGCAALPDADARSPDDGFGGAPCASAPDGGAEACFDAGEIAGPAQEAAARASCDALLAKTCGATDGPRCDDGPACTAAGLLAVHEPGRCEAALSDESAYPPCTASACDSLVARVCGGDPPSDACADAPGCDPALRLQERATDPSSSAAEREDAQASCAQALEDTDIFAPCSP